jgi:acyl-ACP thioesterase
MTKEKVGVYKMVAEPFHCDFSGRLTWCVLGNHLLNCAGFHASERGFGMAELNQNHYTWVLSRLSIEMDDMPREYEPFEVKTWVEDVYRLFTDRNFAVVNNQGKTIGYARSVWAMISQETRKPADLLQLHGGSITDYIYPQEPCPIDKAGRVKAAECTLVGSHSVVYSDIDINGHVNSIKYIEHILDLFPLDTYRTRQLKRFEVAYVAEGYAGDILLFYRQAVSEKEYDIEIKKDDGTVLVRSKMIFK